MTGTARRFLTVAAAIAAVAGCASDSGTGTDVLVVSTIEVSPSGASLIVGQTEQFSATPKTSGGLAITGRTVTWSSANSAVASVSTTGLVTAVAVGGPVNITATVDRVSASVPVTVSPVPVASVTVSPDQAAIVVGEAVQLAATPRDAGGQPLAGRAVAWTSDNAAIATVTPTGSVIGVAVGTTTIRATSEGKVGTATIAVGPRPAARLGFLVHPPNGTAGQLLAPAVQVAVQDNIGGTVASATTAITLALGDNPGGATLGGSLTVAAIQGVATFTDLILDKAAGGYTLRASAAPLSPALSNPFSIGAGAATQLALTTQPPGSAQSGVPLSPQPVVQLRDAFGNPVTQAGVSVTATLVGTGATLLGTTVVLTNASGVAAFASLVISGAAGSYTIRFNATGLVAAESTPITVGAGSADRLAVTTQPSGTAQSGVPFAQQPVIQLRDASGNSVARAGIIVTATIATGTGTLGGVVTATTNASGQALFADLFITGPVGQYTLAFSAPGLLSVTSGTITLSPGAAAALAMVTEPSTAAQSGVAFSQQPAVRLVDGGGNPVAQAGRIITVTLVGGGGTLGGTLSATTDASGVAQFTGLSITGLVGTYRLAFASTGLAGITSGTIALSAGAPARLFVLTQPSSSAQSGVPFAVQPVIQIVDQAGNAVSLPGRTVTAALASGSGTLNGTLTATTAANGRATFTDLAITGPSGTYTIQFSSAGLTSVTSGIVGLGAGVATQLSLAAQPSATAQSGVAFAQQPVVQLRDAANNPVSLAGITVTAAIASGTGTLLGTVTAVTNGSGTATFTDLALSGLVGGYTLGFSATGLAGVTSGTITLSAGPAAQLAITTQPSATAQNTIAFAQQPVIQLQDGAGNPVAQAGVNVTVAIATGGGTLNGTATVATNAAGTASFAGLSITGTVGPRTLGFTAPSLTGVTSGTITLTAGPATKLTITTQPSATTQSGVVFAQQPVVQLRDVSDNAVSQAGVAVTAAIASGGGTLGGTATVNTNASGVASFTNLSITGSAGDRTLSFSATGLTGVTSTTVTLTAGSATQLSITTQPSAAAQSGVAFPQQPVIQLRDGSGNPVAQAGVNVTAVLATGTGTLGGTVTVATNVSGVATFTNLAISGLVGNKTIRFDATGLTSVTSNTIVLSAGPAARLAITVQPSPTAQSGVPFPQQPVIQLQDGAGNNVAQSNVGVTASIASGTGATLGGGTVVLTDATGRATFTTLELTGTSGNFTLGFASSGLTGVTSNTIALGAGAPSVLSITTQPSATVANGVAFPQQPVIQLRDASNNPVAQAGVLVTVTIQSGGPALSGTVTVATNASGAAVFTNLTITGPVGDRTLIFAASGYTSVTSNTITVTAGAPAALEFLTAPPATAQSGIALSPAPVIRVVDQSGNPVGQSGISITAAIASGGGTLSGTNPVSTNTSGQATFTGLTITGLVGDRTLGFSATGLTGVTSGTITLTAGSASRLAITTAPSATATSGVALAQQPAIQVQDGAGNPVGQSGVLVTASFGTTPGGTPSLSNATATTNASGLATFSGLAITGQVGGYTLQFNATGLTGTTSGTITLSAGAATQLTITTQPSAAAQNTVALVQQPAIQLRDAAGNPVSQSGVTVTATFATTPGGTPSLTNATATTNAGGLATFSGLAITGLTGGYTLRFGSGSLTSVVSNTITLSAGPATTLAMFTEPSAAAQSGVAFAQQPVVRVTDVSGNTVSGTLVTAAIATGQPGATLNGTLTATSAPNGRASFTNLGITGLAGNYTLQFTATGTSPATSTTIALSAGAASRLAITTQPGGGASGSPLSPQPVIQIQDAAGNPVSQSGTTITATFGTTPGGTPSLINATAATGGTGAATFTGLTITGPVGGYTLQFNATGLTGVTSASLTLTAGAASQIDLTTGVQANSRNRIAFLTAPVARVRDAAGNPVSGATINAALVGAGTLGGTTSGVSNASGQVTFTGLTITSTTLGLRTINFTAGALTTSGTTTLAGGVATQLAMVTQPGTPVTSGSLLPTQPAVRLLDQDNNQTDTAATTVNAAVVQAGATLGGTTGVATAAGVATWTNLTMSGTAGSYTIQFSATGLTSVTSNAVQLNAGAASQIDLTTGVQANSRNRIAFLTAPVARVRDASGNPVSGVTINAALVGAGTLGGTASGISNASGQVTFTGLTITSTTLGLRTINFTAGALTTSGTTTLAGGVATQLAMVTQPGTPVTSGSLLPTQPAVRLLDQDNNQTDTAATTVNAAVVQAGATLGGTTGVATVAGVATWTNLTMSGTAGSYTIQFSATGLTSVTSSAVQLNAGSATQISVTNVPATSRSGLAFTTAPVATVRDASNNPVAGQTITVTLTGAGDLIGTTSGVSNASGQVTFTGLGIASTTLGSRQLTFTSGALTTNGNTTLSAGPAKKLAILTQPGQTTARNGLALVAQPVIQVQDSLGNPLDTAATITATFGSNPAGPPTPVLAGATASTGGGNTATYTALTITGPIGGYTISFGAGTLTPAVSSSITLAAGDPASVTMVTQPPASIGSGAPFTPVVTVADASGNPVAGQNVTVTLATGTGTFSGPTTVATVGTGTATFTNLAVNATVGVSYSLRFTAGAASVTSNTFSITVGAATQLVITTQPGGAAANAPLSPQPVVQFRDSGDNLVSTTASVTAVLLGTGGAFTGGSTVTVAAVGGVATFTDLAITAAGTYTIRFDATAITSATSGSVVITP